MRGLPPCALVLLLLAPGAGAGQEALAVTSFQYVLAPRVGDGPLPAEARVVVALSVRNAGASDVTGAVATLYAGPDPALQASVPLPTVRAGATVHLEVATDALPLPYYCVTLGTAPALPPSRGFETGECRLVGGVLPP